MKKVFAAVLFLGVMTGFAMSSKHEIVVQPAEASTCHIKGQACGGNADCCSHICIGGLRCA